MQVALPIAECERQAAVACYLTATQGYLRRNVRDGRCATSRAKAHRAAQSEVTRRNTCKHLTLRCRTSWPRSASPWPACRNRADRRAVRCGGRAARLDAPVIRRGTEQCVTGGSGVLQRARHYCHRRRLPNDVRPGCRLRTHVHALDSRPHWPTAQVTPTEGANYEHYNNPG